MTRIIILLAFFLISAISSLAQDIGGLISTSTVDGARFEIVQPGDKTVTFRLDKFTGTIHRLATCPKDDSTGSNKCWKEMEIVDSPKAAASTKIRFQIVVDPALKSIFLLQIDTGKTWQFGVDPLDKWHPFVECNDRTTNFCMWRRD